MEYVEKVRLLELSARRVISVRRGLINMVDLLFEILATRPFENGERIPKRISER